MDGRSLGISLLYPEGWETSPPEWTAGELEGVDFVEIPGAAQPDDEAWSRALDAWRVEVGIHDLAPARFIRQARETGGGIFATFKENFRDRLRLAGKAGITRVSADFDLGDAALKETVLEEIALLLPGFFGVLEEYRMTLLATARFPSADPEAWRHYHQVWNRLRHRRLHFALDVHIHEVAARQLENELLGLIDQRRWELEVVRFHYEPELGNRLPARSIRAVLERFERYDIKAAVTAAPLCLHKEALNAELGPVRELFGQVR